MYGDKSISLLKALDPESGVIFSQNKEHGVYSALIDKLEIEYKQEKRNSIELSLFHQKLLKVILSKAPDTLHTIDLSNEFKTNSFESSYLPSTMNAIINLYKEEDDVQAILKGIYGSSANSILSRFNHLHEKVFKLCEDIHEYEDKNSNVIFAEITHLPEARSGNLLEHKSFVRYQLPMIYKGPFRDEIILLSDLYLKMKEGGKLKLYSKRLNKEVIPILNNAYNFKLSALPVYKFLCSFQASEKITAIEFSWGPLLKLFSKLPRVKYKNIIVSPATWVITQNICKSILKQYQEDSQIVNHIRKKYALPKKVIICKGDQELLLNLENEICVCAFVNELRKNRSEFVLLKEVIAEITPVCNEMYNSFNTELILPVFINHEDKIKPKNEYSYLAKKVKYDSQLGEEWLYLKLYCGVQVSDTIIKDDLLELKKELKKEGYCNKFFFIRYADPDFHIRLRILLKHKNDLSKVLTYTKRIFEKYLKENIIYNIISENYQREINRYGHNTIHICEQLFSNDSMAAINFLNSKYAIEYRWLYSLGIIDSLMNQFNMNLEQKSQFISRQSTLFEEEFIMTKKVKVDIGKKFREKRQLIKFFFEGRKNEDFKLMKELIVQKSIMDLPYISKLNDIYYKSNESVPFFDLLASLMHMSFLRIFIAEPRKHEMITYALLKKYYMSRLHQNSNKNSNIVLNKV